MYNKKGTTIMDNRYIRHEYWIGTGTSIVGSWGTGHYTDLDDVGSEYMSLTFYPNGYYIHWQSDNPHESNDNGGGVEYGTYTYDPSSQQLLGTPILDENGSLGMSEDEQPTRRVEIAGDILTSYHEDRVRDGSSSSIVGSWGTGHYTDHECVESEYMSLTFYPNGYYIHWEPGYQPDDNGGGVEYGTYTYDPGSQQLIATPILDENGCIGLAKDGEQTISQVEVSGDTLTIDDSDVVECTLERVK
jgi:hypothetical protein